MSSLNLNILDEKRQAVLAKLFANLKDGYLAGGTALALQIGHRYSYDFDFFLPHEIGPHNIRMIDSLFGISQTEINNSDQLTVIVQDNIKITLLFYYFQLINPLVNKQSFRLASIEDLAADKAHTIGRRTVWRDYVDIFFILHSGCLNLNKIISLSEKKFKKQFDSILFLSQLTYFENLEITKISFLKDKYTDIQIKDFLIKTVKNTKLI